MTECRAVGCDNDPDAYRGLCSTCASRKARGYRVQTERPWVPQHKVMVLSCPGNVYPRGSLLDRREFFPQAYESYPVTIEEGYWPEGLTFRTQEGEVYRVVGEQLQPQELELIDDS